jgi:PAS domain S-box-containing protein
LIGEFPYAAEGAKLSGLVFLKLSLGRRLSAISSARLGNSPFLGRINKMSTFRALSHDPGSSSPLARLHEDDHRSHVVQFYAEDASLLEGLGRFIGSALGAGDGAVVVATQSHLVGLAQRLEARGLDIYGGVKQGRYIQLDATEALARFMVDGRPDAARFADAMGGFIERARAAAGGKNSRVVVFGEMVALLWMDGRPEAAIQLEELWNELAQKHSFSLRCAYPLAGFSREEHGEAFLKICAGHSGVIPGESYTALNSEEERHRHVSYLQQKANALETERADRKEVQKFLRLRESELADLLENAVEGVQQVGPDQKIRWANRALLRLLGYTAEEYVDHEVAAFHVQRQTFDEFWEKLMRREELYDYPAELRCKDGSVKRVLIHSNGLWESGQFVHTRCFVRDVTEQKRIEEALKLAHDELEMRVHERTVELDQKSFQILQQAEILELANQGLRDLSARLLQVQDEERRRIARDLHDSTGQALALLSMNLSALETEAEKVSTDLAKMVSENLELAKQVSTDLRTISYLLHPPLLDEMGLGSALGWYIDGFGKRSGIQVSLDLASDLERLSQPLELTIFRVVQECLTNIHRHSESPTASIRLYRSSGKAILEIRDEGKGIGPEKLSKIATSGASGVGLRGMRERIKDFAGELEILSGEKGTRIRIAIPLTHPEADLEIPGAVVSLS